MWLASTTTPATPPSASVAPGGRGFKCPKDGCDTFFDDAWFAADGGFFKCPADAKYGDYSYWSGISFDGSGAVVELSNGQSGTNGDSSYGMDIIYHCILSAADGNCGSFDSIPTGEWYYKPRLSIPPLRQRCALAITLPLLTFIDSLFSPVQNLAC